MVLNAEQIRAALNSTRWHDLQRTSLTRQQYATWIERTANRIRGAHPSLKEVRDVSQVTYLLASPREAA